MLLILAASLLDLSILTAGAGADYGTTKWAISNGSIEANSIVQKDLLKAKIVGGVLIPYVGLKFLRSKGHTGNKIANIALVVVSTINVYAIIRNTRNALRR